MILIGCSWRGLLMENGRFPSNEGQDVQLTLDAIQTLKHYSN